MNIETVCARAEFENLSKLGFAAPTAIQSHAMPLLAEGKSMFALAPTGSGKTLAFLLPLMARLNSDDPFTQLLILAPTRELGAQIAQVATSVSDVLAQPNQRHLLVRTAFGGQTVESQKREISKGPHVVVATPGRAVDLAARNVLNLAHLKSLVLDEADLMLSMGFAEQMQELLAFVPKGVQTGLFSATEMQMSGHLESRLLRGKTRVDVRSLAITPDAPQSADASEANDESSVQARPKASPTQNTPNGLAPHYYLSASDELNKRHMLVTFLTEITPNVKNGIVFCQTRENVQEIGELLRDRGFSAAELSGDLGQIQRSTILRRFKAEGLQYLVATNIAARGIDIEALSVVVNFDLPSTAEEYVHRAGRTGRAGLESWVVSLCTQRTKDFLFELASNVGVRLERHSGLRPKVLPSSSESDCVPPDASSSHSKRVAVGEALTFTKLHLNRGKADKIRPGDILGSLTKGLGLEKSAVGSIYIFDHFTHVEIDVRVSESVKRKLGQVRIKNLSIKVQDALTP